MIRISFAFVVSAFVLTLTSCKKDQNQSEAALFGTWVKGTNAGDTLQFMRKNGKNILRYNMSFNASMTNYTEQEYKYHQGKLSIKLFSPSIQDYYPIDSFTWLQTGSEFKLLGIQLFSFMSSTQTYFTYQKI